MLSAFVLVRAMALPESSETVDSVTPDVTRAAAAILGPALKGTIENIENYGVPVDRDELMRQLRRIVDGEVPDFSYEEAYGIIDRYVEGRQKAYVDSVFSADEQKKFVEQAAAAVHAVVTASGLVFTVITEGEGVSPMSNDRVSVMYVAKLSDGTVFDETDAPVTFDVDNLVPGFTEGLKLMRPGGRYRLVIPSDLAYGEEGIPGDIPPNAALDFTVDLLQVIPVPTSSATE